MRIDNSEVLVTGAGPVGLFTAVALASKGIQTTIVDTGVWPCTHSYALALHPQSIQLLRQYDLGDDILDYSYAVKTVGLYEGNKQRAKVNIAGDTPVAVLRQDLLEKVLEQRLRVHDIEVKWRHEVTGIKPGPDQVDVTIDRYDKDSRGYVVSRSEWYVADTSEIAAQFVVGADGYNSRVRRAAKLGFHEVAPAKYYAVFEFQTDVDLGGEMRILMGENTTDVLWPLPGDHYRWSFELPNYHDELAENWHNVLPESPTKRTKDRHIGASGEEYPELSSDLLHELIAERAPWFKASIGPIAWRTLVRFEQRRADAMASGRLILAGDSAHLTGPAGIQSMNAGLSEGQHIADVLHSVLRGGQSLAAVQGYSDCWLKTWERMQSPLGILPGADPWVAAHADRLTSCLPGVGAPLAELAAQVGLQL